MGTGKLNVWITEIGKPCSISNNNWTVAILDCEGKLLEWCGKKYIFPAPCGHVEIPSIPPGRYLITAARYIRPGPSMYWNVAADFTVTNVNCGEETCVTLYTPTYPKCGYLFKLATHMLANQGAIPKVAADHLIKAIDAVLQEVPKAREEFEKLDFINILLKENQQIQKDEVQ